MSSRYRKHYDVRLRVPTRPSVAENELYIDCEEIPGVFALAKENHFIFFFGKNGMFCACRYMLPVVIKYLQEVYEAWGDIPT